MGLEASISEESILCPKVDIEIERCPDCNTEVSYSEGVGNPYCPNPACPRTFIDYLD